MPVARPTDSPYLPIQSQSLIVAERESISSPHKQDYETIVSKTESLKQVQFHSLFAQAIARSHGKGLENKVIIIIKLTILL
jgi:hypothetical protein